VVTPASVIDTNVLNVANNGASHDPGCVRKCVRRLRQVRDHESIVIDNHWLILREYGRKLNQSGQPGVGDAFLKWILTNQGNPQRCVVVDINPTDDSHLNFSEFPKTKALEGFDPDDRKFVAAAIVAGCPVLVALDTDWWQARHALEDAGVKLEFICEAEVAQLAGRRRR